MSQAGPGDVALQWNRLASDDFVRDFNRVSWTGVHQIQLNHNYLVTGNRDWYWIDWLRDRYFDGGFAGDVLSLGCGAGHLDQILKRRGFAFRSLTGIDISPRAIDRARELAREAGLAERVDYVVADLNRHELPPLAFDFIYFFQSLHHIEALEHVLDQCRRALRPAGILLVNEFVGPSRFQWTGTQVEMANALIALIPESLRADLTNGGVKAAALRPTVDYMIRTDPSESVRSADIEPALKERFDVIDEWNWGGTLNNLVFQNIAGNFDPENAYQGTIVELLIHHENVLIRERVLPSDFKVFVARKRQ